MSWRRRRRQALDDILNDMHEKILKDTHYDDDDNDDDIGYKPTSATVAKQRIPPEV